MRVLGLETSCDETAIAVVDLPDRADALPRGGKIVAQRILSQLEEHKPYGGVVPEIAARAHLSYIEPLLEECLAKADTPLNQIDAIAATSGPGLIGGVMVGMMMGKALALASGKPFIGVNHLEAHALTVRLTNALDFPYLLLLVSGGHCQLVEVKGIGSYRVLGKTIDDAVGEAFDKVAKLLGAGYPGGPAVEKAAEACYALAEQEKKAILQAYPLPRPMKGRAGCDFSFSGLKTAVRTDISKRSTPLSQAERQNLAFAFQEAVADVMVDRSARAYEMIKHSYGKAIPLVIAGGVAANTRLRIRLQELAQQHGSVLVAPPPALCSDNAAMVAWAGGERLLHGERSAFDLGARPRWPLEEMTPPSGRSATNPNSTTRKGEKSHVA